VQLPLEQAEARASVLRAETEAEAEKLVRKAEVEPSFIHRTLSPYASKGCVYQRTAVHSFHEDKHSHGTQATFSIPDSCYIDSTGHFNAVELNICSNQMYYVLWADIIRRREIQEIADWGEEDFKARQLPGMLIVRLSSEFRKPIDARNFEANGHIERMRVMGKAPNRTLFLRTRATFTDQNDGLARCEIDFAIF
jgi:hypothetical protein